MKNRPGIICLAVLALTAALTPGASAHNFGNEPRTETDIGGTTTIPGPLDLVKRAAERNLSACTSPPAGREPLNADRLAALMLPQTWMETVGGPNATSGIPHPMIVGRSDANFDGDGDLLQDGTNKRLYRNSNYDDHRRVFWHPGVGMWQMDDSGQGTNLGIEKWFPYDAVARTMAGRWCSRNFDPSGNMWKGWNACDTGRCRTIYGEIFDETSNSLRHIDPRNVVDYLGGISPRKCRLQNDPMIYDCYYFNMEPQAEGGLVDPDATTGSWTLDRNGGSGGHGPTPLARPFYEITVVSGTNTYELRVWLDEDLPDLATDVTAVRRYGEDARGPEGGGRPGLLWGEQVTLCDVTANRGNC